MKYLFIIQLFFLALSSKAQKITYTDKITPEYYKNIVKNANTASELLRISALKDNPEISKELLDFTKDTFKINFIAQQRLDVDYCTSCFTITLSDKVSAYDVLLNKYYKLLLNRLKTKEDKAVLIAAQKAWLAFRTKETMLWQKLSETQYSGGGTIQNIIINSNYVDVLVNRTNTIAEYYFNLSTEE